MRINLYAIHYPICSARYAVDAFRRLGHAVRHYGPATGTKIWGLDVDPRHVWTPDADYEDADLHIVMDSDPVMLNSTASLKPPVIVWGVDNHVRDYRRPHIERYFLAHRHASVMQWEFPASTPLGYEGIALSWDMTWLPCGFDPALHLPSPIPYAERAYDVCMIGVMYPRRAKLLGEMQAAGLKVLAGTGLLGDDYVRAYQNSRVSLCVSVNDDLAQRVFETAAMGCCVLTDQVADLVASDTNDALGLSGFATYASDDEALAQALELAQTNQASGAGAAARLQRQVWTPVGDDALYPRHSWDARAQQIVEWYEHRYGVQAADIAMRRALTPVPIPNLPPESDSEAGLDVMGQNGFTVVNQSVFQSATDASAPDLAPADDTPLPDKSRPENWLPWDSDAVRAEQREFLARVLEVNRLDPMKPYLNLGCGRIILPDAKPAHHRLVESDIYAYPYWLNVDRNAEPGVDEVVNIFTYPFPWAENSFDGALLAHLVEHIPHAIHIADAARYAIQRGDVDAGPWDGYAQRGADLLRMQDGWYAFFAELYRVLTPGSLVHILAPYGWSQGAITDPTHTRMVTEQTFTHSMQPDPNSPFAYETGGIHFELDASTPVYALTELFQHLTGPGHEAELREAFQTRLNVAYEMYIKLRVVK